MDSPSVSRDADWERWVPRIVYDDPLWRLKVYRMATQVMIEGRADVAVLWKQPGMLKVTDQLYRALSSVGANISEGYSRSGGADRARFYEMALSSARESRHWYLSAGERVSHARLEDRVSILTDIIRMLLALIPEERIRRVKRQP